MKVLLICDDCYHPGEIPRAGLAALEPEGIVADTLLDCGGVTLDLLRSYPVVVLAKGDKRSAADSTPWETRAVETAFEQYVLEGGGVLFLHAGAAIKQGADGMCRLMGHRFLQHPEQCPVTVSPLKAHPITEGACTFTVQDEHYFIDLKAPDADIFLVSVSAHGVQAAGYTRTAGRGRVCTLTPGHNLAVWREPSYQNIIRNAICWCKGGIQV